MKYAVTLDHEIAKAHGWSGTRRRTVTLPDGKTKETMVFGRKPVVLDFLPDEVKNDPKLIVVEVTAAAPVDDDEAEAPTHKKGRGR